MGRTVGAYEAKTHLPKLLEAVEAGETVTITRRGRAVAELRPIQTPRDLAREAIAEIHAARRGVKLGGLGIKGLIEEGRRF
ncbi:MAG TPA: type II toxin-antitoxin system prevent-host-death family antitoxin [Candidatus Baltobacteraceae bacterium]|nr:type II toxin-antitoxin system prevent-host-death family antitoxin [Candidatus Baltobacteraceae bacterium]